jgi:hypothetical protein
MYSLYEKSGQQMDICALVKEMVAYQVDVERFLGTPAFCPATPFFANFLPFLVFPKASAHAVIAL